MSREPHRSVGVQGRECAAGVGLIRLDRQSAPEELYSLLSPIAAESGLTAYGRALLVQGRRRAERAYAGSCRKPTFDGRRGHGRKVPGRVADATKIG